MEPWQVTLLYKYVYLIYMPNNFFVIESAAIATCPSLPPPTNYIFTCWSGKGLICPDSIWRIHKQVRIHSEFLIPLRYCSSSASSDWDAERDELPAVFLPARRSVLSMYESVPYSNYLISSPKWGNSISLPGAVDEVCNGKASVDVFDSVIDDLYSVN